MQSTSKYIPALRFHWLTPYYDFVVRITTREGVFKRALVRQAMIESKHSILDLACGTGTLSIWIKEAYPLAVVVGVDGDAAALSLADEKARAAGVALLFDKSMSYSLPYPDAYFDRVVSSLFFHHLSWNEKVRTMQEISRVLKPGGELHVADWGKSTNLFMRALFVFIQLLDGFKNTQDNVSGKLIPLMEHAGLSQVSERRVLSTMFGTMALYSAVKSSELDIGPVPHM